MDDNIHHIFPKVLKNFNTSFKQVSNKKINNFLPIVPPSSVPNHVQASTVRFKSNTEKIKIALVDGNNKKQKTGPISMPCLPKKTPKKMSSTCSFCKSCEHQKTRCDIKASLDPPKDADLFVPFLLLKSPFLIFNQKQAQDIITTDISCTTGSKQIVVHLVHATYFHSTNVCPMIQDLVATIILLDSFAQPLPGYKRDLVEMSRVVDYIYKHKGTEKRHVFSTIHVESFGQLSVSCDSSNQCTIDLHPTLQVRNPYLSYPLVKIIPQFPPKNHTHPPQVHHILMFSLPFHGVNSVFLCSQYKMDPVDNHH